MLNPFGCKGYSEKGRLLETRSPGLYRGVSESEGGRSLFGSQDIKTEDWVRRLSQGRPRGTRLDWRRSQLRPLERMLCVVAIIVPINFSTKP